MRLKGKFASFVKSAVGACLDLLKHIAHILALLFGGKFQHFLPK
jgi:hypothetical protein